MKKLLFLLAVSILTLQAEQVIPGHIACTKETWLKDTIRFGQTRDMNSLKTYLKMERCYVMKSPVEVKVIRKNLDSTQFFLRGQHFWAVPQAVR
ncbi:MAG: hypothetical protein AB7E49_03950 [Campylobacterales bacterium]